MATRAITSYAQPHLSLTNVVIKDNAGNIPIALSRDRTTVYAAGSGAGGGQPANTALLESKDDGTTWAPVHTFSVPVGNLVELADGEALMSSGNSGGVLGQIWRSTGWSNNHFTATWVRTHIVNHGVAGPYIYPFWGFTLWCVGENGVVVCNENGNQASVPPSSDIATKVYLSTDYGKTFTEVWDIVTSTGQPGGSVLHMHACAYDEANDRIWLVFGDGDASATMVGSHHCSIAYSDDRFVSPVTFLPQPVDWNSSVTYSLEYTRQGVAIAVLGNSIIYSSDGTTDGYMVIPKTGYRTLGEMFTAGIPYGTPGYSNLNRGFNKSYGANMPLLFGFSFATSRAEPITILASNDDGLSTHQIYTDTTGNTSGGLFKVLGPTKNGKVIADYRYTNSSAYLDGAHLIGTLSGWTAPAVVNSTGPKYQIRGRSGFKSLNTANQIRVPGGAFMNAAASVSGDAAFGIMALIRRRG